MKATLRLPDGTVIEAEGTPEEIRRLAEPAPFVPYTPPAATPWQVIPFGPLVPTITPSSPWPTWLTYPVNVNGSAIQVTNIADPHARCFTYSTSRAEDC